jgi:hypothetical protein
VTVTTTVKWRYRGVDLNTLAWNIKTRGGSRMGTADPRGENQLIPGVVGRRYLAKPRDSRIITLAMWARGSDADGTRPVTRTDLVNLFDYNWETLANLFDADGQYDLEKTFRTGPSGTLKTATAQAEYWGGLDPDTTDEFKLDFAPQLLLADPWFYGAQISGLTGAVTIDGNKPTDHVVLTIPAGGTVGWQSGERFITNGSGVTVTVDCREHSAYGGGTYQNGLITRDRNTADWCVLNPGAVTFTGSGTVAYSPAWR